MAVDVVKADPVGAIQTVLDVAGMVPVIGEVCDVARGVISAVRGDAVGAALSFASTIPVAGNVTGAAKMARTAIKTGMVGYASLHSPSDCLLNFC